MLLKEKKLRVAFIIEVMGRPAEYIAKALEDLVARLAIEQDVQVTNKKFHEPKEVEQAKNLFVTFAEVEFLTTTLDRLMEMCFVYMPSSVELIEPAELRFSLNDVNAVLNALLARLHKYDEIAKTMIMQTQMLQSQLKHYEGLAALQSKAAQPAEKKKAAKKDKSKKKG